MSIVVSTTAPAALLASIRQEIQDDDILTWTEEIYQGQVYFTHNPEQWFRKAWLKPVVMSTQNILRFDLVWPNNVRGPKAVSGIYHGRFIEMLCNHFPEQFTTITSNLP